MTPRFLLCVTVLVLLALDPQALFSQTAFYVFQTRDLDRASRLLEGQIILFGPEMTGGGHLPGPFYYLLLAAALAIQSTWESAWLLMLALATLAGSVGGWGLARVSKSPASGLLFAVLFALSIPTQRLAALFLNVSYSLPFSVGSAVFLALAFTATAVKTRTYAFVAFGILTSLGLQLHFSNIFWVVAAFTLQIFGPRLGLTRLPARTWILMAASLVTPLSLYSMHLLLGSLGLPSGQPTFYSGSSSNALPSLMHMLPYITELGPARATRDILLRLVETLPLPLLVLLAVRPKATATPLERLFLVCVAVGFIPFSYWFFADIGVRYVIPFYVSALLYTSCAFLRVCADRDTLKRFSLACLGAGALTLAITFILRDGTYSTLVVIRDLVAAGLVFAVASILLPAHRRMEIALALACAIFAASLQTSLGRTGLLYPNPQTMPRLRHWVPVFTEVYKQTGWTYDQARERLFYVNHHIEQDPQLAYEYVTRQEPTPNLESPAPDGFFVALNPPDRLPMALPAVSRWILNQALPADLRAAVLQRELVFLPLSLHTPLLLAYRISDQSQLPKHIHNLGQGYLPGALDRELAEVPGSAVTTVLKDRLVFKWNECPGEHPYCATGAFVSLVHSPSGWRADVTIAGSALSQISPWIAPDWTQAWVRPYLTVRCGEREHQLDLAESVGYRRIYASDPRRPLLRGNNSLVAPFRRSLPLPCKNRPRTVGLGHHGSEIETVYKLRRLPSRYLSVDLEVRQ